MVEYDGIYILIDGGDREHAGAVAGYLETAGVDTLDLVILTHPHADHYGGLDSVVRTVPVRRFIHNGETSPLPLFRTMMSFLSDSLPGTIVDTVVDGQMALGESLTVDYIRPAGDMPDGGYPVNARSVVCRIAVGNASVLFTGDIPAAVESVLVTSGSGRLGADLLKVAHHGSRTSSCALFLEAVAPDAGVISCGEDNTYGHPHVETTDRLEAAGIAVYRTDRNGTCIADFGGDIGLEMITAVPDP